MDDRDLLIRLDERVAQLVEENKGIKADVAAIKRRADQWKGATAVLLALGGILGTAITTVVNWLK